MAAKNILLVEGKSDEVFFGALYKTLGLSAKVQVAPPLEVGGSSNNKEGALNHLPVLLNQLPDGQLERLGVIVDADYSAAGGLGYQRTVDRVSEIVLKSGFSRPKPIGKSGGLAFSSADGFHDFGLWVMPDNHNDGMLEDWIKSSIVQSESPLLTQAQQAVGALKEPKFKQLHLSKAEVATWLAWQRNPGRGFESAVTELLLDRQARPMDLLEQWSRHIFDL